MSEPGTSAVAIETVEWSAVAGGNLAVRITGRWRRRRPVSTGQPTLVIEIEGRRHPFPAMPEPPSVGGAGPGLWRLSFTVPGWMAPELGRTWLQFGTVIVPLPVAVPAPGEPPAVRGRTTTGPRPPADDDPAPPLLPLQRTPDEPGGPPDFGDARGVAELTRRVEALEEELSAAHTVRDELAASLEERERERRIAEQRAHAEQALRRDLARQLSTSAREAERAREAQGDLAAAEERIRGLEQELNRARRRSDEAEQMAAAATAARQRAERGRELAEQRLLPPVPPRPGPRPPTGPLPAPLAALPPAEVWAPAPPPDAVVAGLRAELESRSREDAALRGRLIDAESRLAARVLMERRTAATLGELRVELDWLADELARERLQRVDAERRAAELERELRGRRALSLGAYRAIGELGEQLERLAEPEPESEAQPEPEAIAEPEAVAVAPDPPPAALVEPTRLNDALTRLRETIAPQDAPGSLTPAPVIRAPSMHEALARPSLEHAFRSMARTDPDAAGRLLLDLLPLQRVVYPHAVTYDLVLAHDRCLWVSVPNGVPTIEVQSTARPRRDVDFQVVGDPARLARLLTAGWFRRRFGRTARVRGRRQGVVALSALLGAPLDLGALHHAGVRPDPAITFALLATMIDPGWTAAERFTLAHATPETTRTYLVVREGRPLTATRVAPDGGATTTLTCAAEHLLAALAGEPAPGIRVTGDAGAFLSLRRWIKRAQSE